MKGITPWLFLLALVSMPGNASSQATPLILQSESVTFAVEEVIDGLGVPWGLAFISNTQVLITEREGSIKLLDIQSKNLTPVQGVPDVN